jgi:recombination protein RecR
VNPIDKLTQLFERFPGIGPRQARRFVQYLLSAPPGVRADLARQINALGAASAQCKRCFRWFTKDPSTSLSAGGQASLCRICADSHRDASLLFVVEKDADLDQVERSGFKGLYFVLGGAVPLAAEEPSQYVRLRELAKRAQEDAGTLKEIILGLSATAEGDHTRQTAAEALRDLAQQHGFKLSRLGRGLSTGSELEYADPDTIASALNSRN